MAAPSVDLLKKHLAFVPSDTAFQRRARLLQALWREEQALPIGTHNGRELGSRLPPEMAKDSLANFLTAGIKDIVRREVQELGSPKLYAKPRIYNDLLSSQPLAFNLFGELSLDLGLATSLFYELWPQDVERVTRIEFEFSPGRGDPRFTADASAFDVFVVHTTPKGGVGFVGIEVKYHESLQDKPSSHKPRYDTVAEAMGEFTDDSGRLRLQERPLQQIWRDHLLAGALRLFGTTQDIGEPGKGPIDSGRFVFLAPSDNSACSSAVTAYRCLLRPENTFADVSIERVVEVLGRHTDALWLRRFRDRYLAWDKIDRLVKGN